MPNHDSRLCDSWCRVEVAFACKLSSRRDRSVLQLTSNFCQSKAGGARERIPGKGVPLAVALAPRLGRFQGRFQCRLAVWEGSRLRGVSTFLSYCSHRFLFQNFTVHKAELLAIVALLLRALFSLSSVSTTSIYDTRHRIRRPLALPHFRSSPNRS